MRHLGRAANSSDFSENVRYFARSPTVRPSYLLSEKWQKSEEAVHKYMQTSTGASWQVHEARHPRHKHNPSRLSEPNQVLVAGKPSSQVFASFSQTKKSLVAMATNWSDVTYLKMIPVSDFFRNLFGSPV